MSKGRIFVRSRIMKLVSDWATTKDHTNARLGRWQGLWDHAYAQMFTDLSELSTIPHGVGTFTYGDACNVAGRHFPWFVWPSRIIKELVDREAIAWVTSHRGRLLPTPETLIKRMRRETQPLWFRALKERNGGVVP